MSQHRWSSRFALALALAALPAYVGAIELQFQTPQAEAPPKRRLVADPAQPQSAPSSLLIEVAGIQEGPETALELATKAVAASQLAYGAKDPRLVIPLTNLGHAKQRAGKSDFALKDFRAAIELAEAAGGPRDPRLFEAWYGLGMAHYSAGRPTSAAQAFETALHVHRVNQGLYTVEQLDVLKALALSFSKSGIEQGALQWQQRRVEVASKAFGSHPEDAARTYVSVGRWLRDQGDPNAALMLHYQAVEMLAKAHGTESPALIGPLLDLALSARLRKPKYGDATAFRRFLPDVPLQHARRIAEVHPDFTPAERAKKLMHIGDMYWIVGRAALAKKTYQKATDIMGKDTKDSPLANPAFIAFKPPEPSAKAQDLGGYVLAEFTVSSLGMARNTRIVEGTHPWLVQTIGRELVQALRAARFRPRIENGRSVNTRGVRYRLVLNRSEAHRAGEFKPAVFEAPPELREGAVAP